MKLLKKITLGITLGAMLAGCGYSSRYGVYSFQMGSEGSAHVGAFLNLSSELYTENPEIKGYNKYDLKIDFATGATSSSAESSTSAGYSGSISGYFRFEDAITETNGYGTPLTLAIMKFDSEALDYLFGEEIAEFIRSIKIPPEIVDKILQAYWVNMNKVNFHLPVSLKDFKNQLYWLGYEFQIVKDPETGKSSIKVVSLPAEEHHNAWDKPTDEQVAELEEKGYGRFWTITLGLIR